MKNWQCPEKKCLGLCLLRTSGRSLNQSHRGWDFVRKDMFRGQAIANKLFASRKKKGENRPQTEKYSLPLSAFTSHLCCHLWFCSEQLTFVRWCWFFFSLSREQEKWYCYWFSSAFVPQAKSDLCPNGAAYLLGHFLELFLNWSFLFRSKLAVKPWWHWKNPKFQNSVLSGNID